MMRAIYGMLISAMLWYKKFRNNPEKTGFIFNAYDPFIANKKINGGRN